MWNKNRSLNLSHFLVRAFYFVIAVVFAFCIYFLVFDWFFKSYIISLLITLPFGLGALICLDKLLMNLKKKVVFDIKNVEIMRKLSWVCFSVSLVTLIEFVVLMLMSRTTDSSDFIFSLILYSMYPIMCIGEFFVGLIVRVVKNSFESAIALKEENDLTI